MHASQRHKLEVGELVGRPVTYGAATITYGDGTYPAEMGVTAWVTGDSSGLVSAFVRIAAASSQAVVATAVAAAINALADFAATATLGVVTVTIAGANTTVAVVNTSETLD